MCVTIYFFEKVSFDRLMLVVCYYVKCKIGLKKKIEMQDLTYFSKK